MHFSLDTSPHPSYMKHCCKAVHLCPEKSDKLGGLYVAHQIPYWALSQAPGLMQNPNWSLKLICTSHKLQLGKNQCSWRTSLQCCFIHQIFYMDCHRSETGMIPASNHISHCMTLMLWLHLFSIKLHVRACTRACGGDLSTQMAAWKEKTYHTEMMH
jgi:hypothetical protein